MEDYNINKTFIIDIDDTLILYPVTAEKSESRYKSAIPNNREIMLVNKLYDEGNNIILHTGRGFHWYEFTKKQLKKMNIRYHELIMAKPVGIYIDKDSFKSLEDYLD